MAVLAAGGGVGEASGSAGVWLGAEVEVVVGAGMVSAASVRRAAAVPAAWVNTVAESVTGALGVLQAANKAASTRQAAADRNFKWADIR